jgi:DNA-binding transcriptional MocR family regulator
MRSSPLPTLQLYIRPDLIDLTWGHPPLDLLPVEAMQRASVAALDRYGGQALTYGYMAGPGPLLDWLRARIGQQEGCTPNSDEIMITGGNSQALDQILTLCSEPGDTVLVESPTYHLAVRILRDHPVKLVAVPVDQAGLNVDALAQILVDLRRAGVKPRLFYTIPTYHNPTGVCLSLARRQALVELAASEGFLIVEDDVYRELSYDGPAPPSLWSLAPAGVVARMGSFSKSLAPGLRLGWLTAGQETIARIVKGGLLDSGGGINHFTALVVTEFCVSGHYDAQVAKLQTTYRAQRDAMVAAFAAYLPAGCSWYTPGGGFFAWVMLPEGIASADLLPAAEAHGVSFIPGERFHLAGGGENTLRLAFSLYPPAALVEGVQYLGAGLRSL